MSTNVDDFGSVSKGLDRAQLHDASRGDEWSYSRPTLDAVGYKKPSIRQAFKDNLLSAIVHPRYGANKIKSAIIEKREGSKTGPEDDDRLPTLAPQPAVDQLAKDRLTDGFKEKPQLPPAKEFLHNPVASVITTVQDQRGYDAAENIIKAEVSHGADVQLLRQADKIENSPDGEEKEAEEEIFVQMKHLRQDAFVRWTIDRHVRVVAKRVEVNDPPPQRPPFFKDASADKKISTWSEFSTKVFFSIRTLSHCANIFHSASSMNSRDTASTTSIQSSRCRSRIESCWRQLPSDLSWLQHPYSRSS